MLTYENNLLLTVTILIVPVTVYARVVYAELAQFLYWHRGIPLSCILQLHLSASLLEDVAQVGLVLKPAQSLGTYHALRPSACHEVVEQRDVKRLACIIDVCADAIFLRVAVSVVVVMSAGALAAVV